MTLTELFDALNHLGARLRWSEDGRLAVLAPAGTVTAELKKALAEHRDTILATLAPAPPAQTAVPPDCGYPEPPALPDTITSSLAMPADLNGQPNATTRPAAASSRPALKLCHPELPQRQRLALTDTKHGQTQRAVCWLKPVVGMELLLPGELWRELAQHLALTAPASESGLGTVMRGFSVPLPGYADVVIHVDLVNSNPRPVLDAYVQRAGRTIEALPPAYSLEQPLRFQHEGQDYWLLLRPEPLS